jgi:hypothetical protein
MAGGFSPGKGALAGSGGWDNNYFGLSPTGKAKGTVGGWKDGPSPPSGTARGDHNNDDEGGDFYTCSARLSIQLLHLNSLFFSDYYHFYSIPL